MEAATLSREDLLAELERGRQHLDANHIEPARTAASQVLHVAEAAGDRSLQGRALMALAQVDRVLGRFRRAVDTVQRAAWQFQLEGDLGREAAALALAAHSCSYLGRDEEAVEAALLAVKLASLLPAGPEQVPVYNYLGVSYLWAKNFGAAEAALREAERIARQIGPQGNVLLPRINLAWLETIRLFEQRHYDGAPPRTEVLAERLALCQELFADDQPFPGLPGVRAVLQRMGRSAQALMHCWRGDLQAAEQSLAAADDPNRPGSHAQVANFVVHWVRAELLWARGELAGAQREAALLVAHSDAAEFEQMATLGHLLAVQLYAAQGQYGQALAEERAYRRRQLRVRADSLASRHRVVQAQLDMRASERNLRLMADHAQELERLSFEDALTGIANRRRFEARLDSLLGGGRSPGAANCMALIDLDDFKRVNDRYSHEAGDHVLRAVAQALRVGVRESDLPARLGGDEFVVLFPHTGEAAAQAVCARLRAAVAALRWPDWPGLQITATIGLAQSQDEDSPAALMLRADKAMFGLKPRP